MTPIWTWWVFLMVKRLDVFQPEKVSLVGTACFFFFGAESECQRALGESCSENDYRLDKPITPYTWLVVIGE